jgi:hypothetical protein
MAFESFGLYRHAPGYVAVAFTAATAATAVTVFADWYWTVLLLFLVQVLQPAFASRIDQRRIVSALAKPGQEFKPQKYITVPIICISFVVFIAFEISVHAELASDFVNSTAEFSKKSRSTPDTFFGISLLIILLPEKLMADIQFNDYQIYRNALVMIFIIISFWCIKFFFIYFAGRNNYIHE